MKNSNNKHYKTIKLFEAFSGIGSQYQALKNIAEEKNWKIEPKGIIEWFIPAIISYQVIHHNLNYIKKEIFNSNLNVSNDSKSPCSQSWKDKNLLKASETGFYLNQSKKKANNFFDISQTKGIDIPNDLDIFTYSFPCQDISNQGKQKGFSKEQKTRSGLLWEIERLFSEIKKDKKSLPKYLLLENVKAMISKNHKANYNAWLRKLKDFGYKSKEYVLNATNFGSCQNRERVFVLSVLEEHAKKINFEFSPLNEIKIENKKPLKDILDLRLKYDDRFNKFNLLEKGLTKNNILKMELENYSNFSSENFVYDINHSGPTLTASGALSRIKLYFGPKKIRSITAKECFKYMGFKEEQYKTIIKHTNITENKLIYLTGNSISVEVLEAIFRTLVF